MFGRDESGKRANSATLPTVMHMPASIRLLSRFEISICEVDCDAIWRLKSKYHWQIKGAPKKNRSMSGGIMQFIQFIDLRRILKFSIENIKLLIQSSIENYANGISQQKKFIEHFMMSWWFTGLLVMDGRSAERYQISIQQEDLFLPSLEANFQKSPVLITWNRISVPVKIVPHSISSTLTKCECPAFAHTYIQEYRLKE